MFRQIHKRHLGKSSADREAGICYFGLECRSVDIEQIVTNYGTAVGLVNGENPCLKTPYWGGECKAVCQASALHDTSGSGWLGTAQQFHHDMRGEGGSRITSKSKQGAHIHQPTSSCFTFNPYIYSTCIFSFFQITQVQPWSMCGG